MSIRPFRNIIRKKTKEITVGNVKIGGNNPISVQSMTNTITKDTKATISQINKIASEGADLVSTGSIINFIYVQSSLKFQVNKTKAEENDLKIGQQLQKLAYLTI